MARDRGSILFSLWGDDDWRELSVAAQHLYMQLLSSPKLNYAGVADWRPGKYAVARDATATERYDAALELAGAYFVVIDDDHEEILVRSFLRHDGLLQKPNVAIAMSKAYADVTSDVLRGVIVHELRRLKQEFPNWKAWENDASKGHMQRLLKARAIDPKGLLPVALNPSDNPSNSDLVNGSPKNAPLHLPLQLPLPTSNEVATTPTGFCSRHPEGTDDPCRACAAARKRLEASTSTPIPPRGDAVECAPDQHRWLADGTCMLCTARQEVAS